MHSSTKPKQSTLLRNKKNNNTPSNRVLTLHNSKANESSSKFYVIPVVFAEMYAYIFNTHKHYYEDKILLIEL